MNLPDTCKKCGSTNIKHQKNHRIKCFNCGIRYRYKKDSSIQNFIANIEATNRITELPMSSLSENFQNGCLNIESNKSSRIKTLGELITDRKIDLTKYELKSWQVTQWEQNSKEEGVVPLYRVYASFKPIVKDNVESAIERYVEKLNSKSIVHERIEKRESKSKYMAVIGLYDFHFGRLSWGKETGHADYDLKIAKRLYVDAV